jgi:hypothetical protein
MEGSVSELKVTPEGMPSIKLEGIDYPLFFSVYGIQRWAEYKGTDYEGALAAGFKVGLPFEDLSKLLEVALAGGEARRHAFGGGSAREIGPSLVGQAFTVYGHFEMIRLLAEAWNMLPGGNEETRPPQADASTGAE